MKYLPLHNPDAAYRKAGDGSVVTFYTRRPSWWRRMLTAVWRWL